MDLIDKKIVGQLLKNSRQSLTKIGKAVRASREQVDYRIKRLEKSVIRRFVTVIDYKQLGFKKYTLFVQYRGFSEKREEDFIEKLLATKRVSWIGTLVGKWSITFDVYVRTSLELKEFISRIQDELVGEYKVLEIDTEEFMFNKLIGTKRRGVKGETGEIDGDDLALLQCLSDNSRVKYTELVNVVGLTANGVKHRIKKLEKGIILQYSVALDHKYFGTWYGLQIKASKRFQRYAAEHRKIIFYYAYTPTAPYSFDIGIVAKNGRELRKFINEVRTECPDVEIENSFVVLDEISPHSLPPIVFE